MAQVTIDEVVAAYMKLRNKKDALKRNYEDAAENIKAKMKKLEAYIKEQADQQGVTSFKTHHGTAFLTTVDYANVADWDATLKFIQEENAWDMLERRVSKRAVRGYIDANKTVPPGVNYGTKIEVNVRKPTEKED